MGDIVGSRDVNSEVELYRNFNEAIIVANKEYKNIIVSPLTVTLGDEFQGLTNNLTDSFTMANKLRVDFLKRNINMRFVIGDSEIDSTIINKKNSWNMLGKGLAEARELLNDKRLKNSYRFNFLKKKNIELMNLLEDMVNTLGESMTKIEQKWNSNQITTIIEYRKQGYNRMKVAEKLGRNRSSLYKSLKSAQVSLYELQIESIISALEYIDKENRKN